MNVMHYMYIYIYNFNDRFTDDCNAFIYALS